MLKKIYVFIGVQGSGKGTQAKLLAQKKGLCHISTGDLFRGCQGKLKEKLDSYMNAGKLIPDELVLEILKARIAKSDCDSGIILDGFPRNLEQAKALEKILKVTKVIEIKLSDIEALKRLSGRRICEKCKEGYNIYTAPKPKVAGICDKCGGKLIQRTDDNEEAIKKRINDYHNETEPLLEHYKETLFSVNGKQSIEDLFEELLKIL